MKRSSISIASAIILAMFSHHAQSARNDDHPGAGVAVHYVRLNGYGGDNEVNRKKLIETHQACVQRQAAFGKPAKPLPPEGIPAIVSEYEIKIHYAANRTLTDSQGTHYTIDFDTCALVVDSHRVLNLVSGAGKCDIDMKKKVARGHCDTAAHERATTPSMSHAPNGKVPAVDLDKVPSHLRAQVEAQLERLKQLPRAQHEDAFPARSGASGQEKVVLNTPCEVHRNDAVRTTLCIARPVLRPEKPLNPYPIPAAPLNAGTPGLLMEADSPALKLQAQEVRLNLSVPRSLFTVPAGVKIQSLAGDAR